MPIYKWVCGRVCMLEMGRSSGGKPGMEPALVNGALADNGFPPPKDWVSYRNVYPRVAVALELFPFHGGLSMLSQLLAVSLSLALGAEPSKPVVSPYDLDPHPVEAQVMAGVNAQRARHGLRPLTLDRNLLRSARVHTAWMARNARLQHTSAAVGENIAEGQTSAPEAVNDWMNSPGHRANILNGTYSRIGMAAYTSYNGRVFWCTQFLP